MSFARALTCEVTRRIGGGCGIRRDEVVLNFNQMLGQLIAKLGGVAYVHVLARSWLASSPCVCTLGRYV